MKWLLLLAPCLGLALLTSFYLNNPIPEEMEESWKYNLFFAGSRIIADVATIGSYLTSTDGRIAVRHVIDTLEMLAFYPVDGVQVSDELFDDVAVRVYMPDEGASINGGLVYLHGGGMIAVTPRGFDEFCSELTRRLNITVASVHYRRIPEHPSPVPLEDSIRATKYFMDHASRYGVDPHNIGVAGDSAGGTLAAAVALHLRDHASDMDIPLKFQTLIYPLLQGVDFTLPSYHRNHDYSIPFTRKEFVGGVVSSLITGLSHDWQTFLPAMLCGKHINSTTFDTYKELIDVSRLPSSVVHAGYERPACYYAASPNREAIRVLEKGIIDPYNFPLMAPSVQELPATLMITVETDTIRDDGYLYVQRLRDAGVDVEHFNSHSGFHGMITFLNYVEASAQTVDVMTNFIARQLHIENFQYKHAPNHVLPSITKHVTNHLIPAITKQVTSHLLSLITL